MKKFVATMLTLAMTASLVACGSSSEKATSGDSTGSKTASETSSVGDTDADSINVCLATEPATLDPALNSAVDGATMCAHLFSGLAKWAQGEDGKLEIAPDCVTELPEGVENADGTVTYTYTLRDGLKWSDGKDVVASDFVYAWNRAASPTLAADYGYMFEIIDGYDDMWEADADGNIVNPDAKLNVTAPDDKTLVVTLKNSATYWNELLAFPAYYPVREDVVSNDAWATDPSTYVGNGPYVMSSWDHNSVITLTKNDNYVDAADVTMETINFYLSDNNNNMLTNFENGDWQFIDDVPTNEMASLKEEYPDEYHVEGQIGTYYVAWNDNESLLPSDSTLTGADAEKANEEIRNAISLLFDRNYIVDSIAQGGQVPASSFVAMGMTDADGSQFYQNAGSSDAFDGYFNTSADALTDNYNSAITTLKKYFKYDDSTMMFTNFPTLTYIYNTSDSHKAIAEYLQSALAGVGITMNLENMEWNTFLETRKAGEFTLARNGWLADYNDPISFLDLWTTASGNNDCQLGKGDNADVACYNLDLTDLGIDVSVKNGTWAETYDVLLDQIKSSTDADTRYELMHRAEDLLMSTGCVCPLYFYTDIYMIDNSVQGYFQNPLGYKYFMYTHY